MEPMLLRARVEGSTSEEHSHADAETVAWAIRRLDGRLYNELVLGTGEPDSLDIAGGLNDRCLVGYFERGGEMIWYAAEPPRGDAREDNVVGGQETEFPARWLVTRAVALQAADYFFHHQARDPALVWEPDPGLMPSEG
jgi:hypothetical protein